MQQKCACVCVCISLCFCLFRDLRACISTPAFVHMLESDKTVTIVSQIRCACKATMMNPVRVVVFQREMSEDTCSCCPGFHLALRRPTSPRLYGWFLRSDEKEQTRIIHVRQEASEQPADICQRQTKGLLGFIYWAMKYIFLLIKLAIKKQQHKNKNKQENAKTSGMKESLPSHPGSYKILIRICVRHG